MVLNFAKQFGELVDVIVAKNVEELNESFQQIIANCKNVKQIVISGCVLGIVLNIEIRSSSVTNVYPKRNYLSGMPSMVCPATLQNKIYF